MTHLLAARDAVIAQFTTLGSTSNPPLHVFPHEGRFDYRTARDSVSHTMPALFIAIRGSESHDLNTTMESDVIFAGYIVTEATTRKRRDSELGLELAGLVEAVLARKKLFAGGGAPHNFSGVSRIGEREDEELGFRIYGLSWTQTYEVVGLVDDTAIQVEFANAINRSYGGDIDPQAPLADWNKAEVEVLQDDHEGEPEVSVHAERDLTEP